MDLGRGEEGFKRDEPLNIDKGRILLQFKYAVVKLHFILNYSTTNL